MLSAPVRGLLILCLGPDDAHLLFGKETFGEEEEDP